MDILLVIVPICNEVHFFLLFFLPFSTLHAPRPLLPSFLFFSFISLSSSFFFLFSFLSHSSHHLPLLVVTVVTTYNAISDNWGPPPLPSISHLSTPLSIFLTFPLWSPKKMGKLFMFFFVCFILFYIYLFLFVVLILIVII